MSERSSGRAAEHVWIAQSAEAPPITLQLVLNLADEHDRRIRRSNQLQYLVIAIASGSILWYAWQIPALSVRLGLLAMLAYVIKTSMSWFKRVRRESLPAELGLTSALLFYRAQLERQREARVFGLRGWLAGLMFAVIFDGLLMLGGMKPWVPLRLALMLSITAVALAIYSWFESREKRRLEKEIQAIDSLRNQ